MMSRLAIFFVASFLTTCVRADGSPPPLAEAYLHEGRFAEGETALLLALDANPADDEARFGLGVL